MPTIKHLLNWGPDTPYCQTEVSYDPADFTSEEDKQGFLSGVAIEALEMKESYINAGLGIGPGGAVAEAQRLGATVISEPSQSPASPPSLPAAASTSIKRGTLPQGASWSGVQHAPCQTEMAFKPSWYNQRSGKTVGAQLVCTGGCKQPGTNYPASEWVKDEDLHMFTNQVF